MTELVLRVDVEAPPEVVWAAATDWAGQDAWMLGTSVTPLAGGPVGGRGLGGRLSARTGLGPIGFTDTMEITRWDPPYRCDVLHTGRVVRGTGVFEVQAGTDGGSVFVWSEQLELPFGALGRVGWRLTKPLTAAAIGLSLRRFARWAPSHLPDPPP